MEDNSNTKNIIKSTSESIIKEKEIIDKNLNRLNNARKKILPYVLALGVLTYISTDTSDSFINYIVSMCTLLLMYIISTRDWKFKLLMYLSMGYVSYIFFNRTSSSVRDIYQLISIKAMSEAVLVLLDISGQSQVSNKLRPIITVLLIGYYLVNLLNTSDPVANLAIISIISIIGISIILFEVFGMNMFTAFLTTFVVSIITLAYSITQLPVICKTILGKEAKSEGNTGLSTAGIAMIIPLLIFSMALYEVQWYCWNGSNFKYKSINKFLFGLILSTLIYVIVVLGILGLNTYMNFRNEMKEGEKIADFIKNNLRKVLLSPLNIVIILALLFPVFTFYITKNMS